jgi:TPR repeat protein
LAAANTGNTQAQAFVFDCYYFGRESVTKDLTLAFKFCRTAADVGHTVSQVNLAGRYFRGEGVERDERKATAWYLRAATEGGDADAQYYTAVHYKNGTGHDAPNLKEAIRWYQAAVAQGHPDAQLRLGNLYNKGDGVPNHPGLALKLWRKCAQHHETGDVTKQEGSSVAGAHNNIGNCYRRGSTGLEVDMLMAMQWWKKVAQHGDVNAQLTIGQIYLKGFLGKLVPVGTFDRDVPFGMKHLRALTAADQKCGHMMNEAAAVSRAEACIHDFHAIKSCRVAEAQRLGNCAAGACTTPTTPRFGTAVKPVSSSTGATRQPRTKSSADLAPPPATTPGMLCRVDATCCKCRAARVASARATSCDAFVC